MSRVALSDICNYRTESGPIDPMTYISTESMLSNRAGITKASSIPSTGKARLFRQGDTLVSNIRPYFKKIWQATDDGCCSADVLVFEPSACHADYLYWLLSSDAFFDYVVATSKGTKMPRGDKAAIMQYESVERGFEDQYEIAMALNPIRELIEINQQTNDYLLKAMEALYREYFTYDGQSFGSIYDIAEVVYGAPFSSKLFNESGDGWPLIRIRDLTTFSPQFFTEEEHPKRTFIEPGDVVAGMDADFTPTLWLGEKAVLNQRVCEFVPPVDSAITKSYLLCATKPLLAYVQNYATGTTVAHLGKGDLEALEVPLPREKDLIKFGQLCEPMRMAIVSNAQESIRLAKLRDALLPKLMTGEIDVSQIVLPTQPNNHLRVG